MANSGVQVDNRVNVEALLAARQALTYAPEAAQFQWRAICKWTDGTHSHWTVEGFFGLGEEQMQEKTFSFDADHPELFASADNGATPVELVLVGLASCLTAGVAAVAQHREIQLRSVTAMLEGGMDIQGILGIDKDVRNGFDGIKVSFDIDADRSSDDINDIGVKIVGRLASINDGKAQFSGALHSQCALADLKMNRLLGTVDEWATENGLDGEIEPPHRFAATAVAASPPLTMDIAASGIGTILWATGYRPDFSWLDVPVLDRKGQIHHDGGVVESPGMYMMGLQFLRRHKSALIDGAGDDARDLSDHLVSYLDGKNTRIRLGGARREGKI